MHTFDLNIGQITKIEGKASLMVRVNKGKIEDLKFSISEYKRFYTQAIRGKDIIALPQLSSRICGTCSNAHLLCAIKAVENALHLQPSSQTKTLRKLMNYGLMIRDHGLHLYVFVLPDIFKVDNILELDEKDEYQHQILHDIFEVKAAGNRLSKVFGGRAVHAPYPTVGGFIKLPEQSQVSELINELEKVRPAVLRLINIFVNCKFSLPLELENAALMDEEFNFLEGKILSKSGVVSDPTSFADYLDKVVIPYSHATGFKFMGRVTIVGALARVNLAKDKLNPRTKTDAKKALELFPSLDIYRNNLAQAIEILHSIDNSVDILKNLKIEAEKPVPVERKKGIGIGVIEAPRGTLYYKLDIDETGKITSGDIIVPTGQNQIAIEKSILEYLRNNLEKDRKENVHEIEKIIRAFDPCMSCASHFLKVKWISE